MTYSFERAELITGARLARQFPPDEGREVAFAGRSNAGKSSVLNALARRRGLARTSKQPGRTRELNFFALPDGTRLVDLPGYGFARVPAEMQRQWETTLERYLGGRRSLVGMVLVMDVRHPFRDLDLTLVDWARGAGVPLRAVLTKADKLSRGRREQVLRAARERCGALGGEITAQLFSAPGRLGVAALGDWIAHRLADDG